jgi:hypothetical protein
MVLLFLIFEADCFSLVQRDSGARAAENFEFLSGPRITRISRMEEQTTEGTAGWLGRRRSNQTFDHEWTPML